MATLKKTSRKRVAEVVTPRNEVILMEVKVLQAVLDERREGDMRYFEEKWDRIDEKLVSRFADIEKKIDYAVARQATDETRNLVEHTRLDSTIKNEDSKLYEKIDAVKKYVAGIAGLAGGIGGILGFAIHWAYTVIAKQ